MGSELEDGVNLDDYRQAPGGDGPLAATWADKPHRLVFDLCSEVFHLRAERDALRARVAELEAPWVETPMVVQGAHSVTGEVMWGRPPGPTVPEWHRRMENADCRRTEDEFGTGWWQSRDDADRVVVWFGRPGVWHVVWHPDADTEEAACLAYLASIGAP